MSQSPMTDIANVIFAGTNAAAILAADDTYVSTGIIDRTAFSLPLSGAVVAGVGFTSAGGAGVATNTMTIRLQHGDNSALSDAATYDSDTEVYTWVANGDNAGNVVLPLNLKAAKRYIRGQAKLTEAGTITISVQSITLTLLLAGLRVVPDSNFVQAGYSTLLEPA